MADERDVSTRHPYAVGLTGGVAAGKSTVAGAFARRGVPVLDADAAARAVVTQGTPGLEEIVTRFGAGVLADDGSLDRGALRRIVFADAEARRALEAIVHPRVRAWMRQHLEALRTPYAVLAIPLLAETWPACAWLDRILVVDVPEAVQQRRLVQRDAIDAELANAMLSAQATRTQRLALAHDVIDNSEPLAALDARVAALHAQYLRLARDR